MGATGRVILVVMDSFGIGGAPDAARFGGEGFTDEGADTLGHIASARACGGSVLELPNLRAMGLGGAHRLATGEGVAGWDGDVVRTGAHGCATSISTGKDTPSGHWEIAGVPVRFAWSYFPDQPDCFPAGVLEEIHRRSGCAGSLGNCHASGTEILERLGARHVAEGLPIFYTSADSVFQIACHEGAFGLDRLLELCKVARRVLDESALKVGRVIARPFEGPAEGPFRRTGNRHDYAVPPPAPTLLRVLSDAGREVWAIGKIGDIYAHDGPTREVRASGHEALWDATLGAVRECADGGMVMVNFVDFDAVHGHRRDVGGYAKSLEEFDARLPELFGAMRGDDLLCITADHGNDPTWRGTDHTRERVPVLFRGAGVEAGRSLGVRETFADIGQTLAAFLGVGRLGDGVAIDLRRG